MRIAYVTIHVAPVIMQGGVGRKVRGQISIWRDQGHEATLFSLTPAKLSFADVRQFIFNTDVKFKSFQLIEREIHRLIALKRMLVAIREYRPDLIYLRFGLYSYPLHLLFKIAPVVLETNSNDLIEYRERGAFFNWMNRLTRNLTFGPASGLIVPSHELMEMLNPRGRKPACVISNGINLKDVEIFPPTNNKSPVITLVGSPGMNWHGVDKLIKLAGLYPDLTVNIIGYSKNDAHFPVPENVHLQGFLSGGKLREVLSGTDAACGTLALHRKNMQEASPLKVREALAHGIPVVVAYIDTDLEKVDLDTILRIPNTEDNVMQNSERIRNFAYNMIGKRVDIASIAPYLDQRRKEETRLTFFQTILDGCKV